MKQVVFAVILIAMASLTGCLNEEDTSVDDTTDDTTSDTTEDNTDTKDDTKDDELIDPVGAEGGYTPPENSDIRVDSGVSGYWEGNNGGTAPGEWIACTEQGWFRTEGGYDLYCDLDHRYDKGPQVWVNKTGQIVTIECIKDHRQDEGYTCKDAYVSSGDTMGYGAYFLFTSAEGFQERVFVLLSQTSRYDAYQFNHEFFTTQVDLKFEPVAFTIVETKGGGGTSAGASANPVGDLYDYKSTTRYF